MSGETWLQIFIYLQVFIIGALAVVAFRHGRAHYRPDRQIDLAALPPPPELPPEVKRRLMEASEAQFQLVLKHTAEQLNSDLRGSSVQINHLVNNLAAEIVSGELEHYRIELGRLRNQASTQMGAIRAEVDKHKAAIEAKMDQEVAAERQRLIQQIDTKLGDAVASFLTETLQHNVDLGGQTAYLVGLLEEHKADFIKEVKEDDPVRNSGAAQTDSEQTPDGR